MRQLLRIILLFLLLTGCATITQAQYDAAQFSQHFMAMNYYNPAYAGTSDGLNVLTMYRRQWIGVEGTSKSFFVAADMPMKLRENKIGIGAVLLTESIGLFQNSHIAGQVSYRRSLLGGILSVGIQIGRVNNSFGGAGVYIPSSGVYYAQKHFYLGIGAMLLTSSYNLTGGYNIQLKSPLFELQPSVFLKTDMKSFQADITGRVVYNKKINGGLAWRVDESVIALLGATFGDFQIGYAYDSPTVSLLKESRGSHELLVRYKLKLHKSRSVGKHKSVRIL